jgi:hypothetical protein
MSIRIKPTRILPAITSWVVSVVAASPPVIIYISMGFLFLVGIVGFHYWIEPRLNEKMIPFWEASNRLPAGLAIGLTITTLLATVSYILFLAYQETNAFDSSKQNKLFWLYITVAALVGFQLLSAAIYFAVERHLILSVVPLPQRRRDLMLQGYSVLFVLTIGIAIYLFKQRAKFLYGLTEITIGVLANLDFLKDIHESEFPRLPLNSAVLIKLAVFTYLLSRGVANAVEGVQEWIDKKKPGTGRTFT